MRRALPIAPRRRRRRRGSHRPVRGRLDPACEPDNGPSDPSLQGGKIGSCGFFSRAPNRSGLSWPPVVKRLLLASPRGYCAGVERAVETVERALALYGRPVFVRKQIVHNSHVVDDLRSRGAVFVESLREVPEGATVVFSAHGIAPAVRREANELRLTTIDATCPLVTKVHAQARRYAKAGHTIVLIGHAGHEEIDGTIGEAPDSIVLVQSVDEAERVNLPQRRRSRTSRRRRSRSTRRARSSRCCAAASPASRARPAKTSATRPRTGNGR